MLLFITVVIISFLLFAVIRVDFNFKKLITKPSLGSKKKSQGVVSFRDGGQVKLGVPGMAPDAGSPTEMDQVPSSQKDRGWGEWGNLGKSGGQEGRVKKLSMKHRTRTNNKTTTKSKNKQQRDGGRKALIKILRLIEIDQNQINDCKHACVHAVLYVRVLMCVCVMKWEHL